MSLARLIVSEPYQPTRHAVIRETPFVIGRDAACHLVLGHSSVSKRHAEVRRRDEAFVICDLGSKNGTLVNGMAATSQPLHDRDLITVGGLDLVFQALRAEQLGAQLEEEFDKLRTALKFTASIRAASLLDQVLDQVMAGLMRLTQADRGFLLLRDDRRDLKMVRSVNITPEEYRRERSRYSLSAVERAIQTGAPVAVSNAQDDSYYGGRRSVVQMSLKTLVCVPFKTGTGAVAGLLYADSDRREQGFTELDVEVLRSLADNAAIALESARLQSQIRKVLREASAVLSQVESAASLDPSLQSSVRQTLTSMTSLRMSVEADAAELRSGLVQDG